MTFVKGLTMTNNVVSQDEIIRPNEVLEMARQAGFELTINQHGNTQFRCFSRELEYFAKLVAAKEREEWKEIVENQRLRLQALNEIIGGEDSTTTGNILSYSRWEMRLEDAVKEEREACAEIAEKQRYAMNISLTSHPAQNGTAVGILNQIRARGKA
jgi:hypothetical protein